MEAYNIFSDCFAAAGLAEYARATGDAEARQIALTTYARIQERKDNPKGRFTKQIGANRPIKAMAFPMIQVWMAQEMGDLLQPGLQEKYLREAIDQVTSFTSTRKHKAVYERVFADGSHPDCMEGRLLTPGQLWRCSGSYYARWKTRSFRPGAVRDRPLRLSISPPRRCSGQRSGVGTEPTAGSTTILMRKASTGKARMGHEALVGPRRSAMRLPARLQAHGASHLLGMVSPRG